MATYEEVVADYVAVGEYLEDYMLVIEEVVLCGADVTMLYFVLGTSDAVSATDSVTHEVIQWFYESVSAQDTLLSQATQGAAVADVAAAQDVLVALFTQLVSDIADGDDVAVPIVAAIISDFAVSAGLVSSQAVANQALADIVVGLDAIQRGLLEGVADTATGADAVTQRVSAMQALLDQASATTATTSYALVLGALTDSVQIVDTLALWQSLTSTLADGASVFVHLVANGEVYTGWVMNTQNGAVIEYQGLSFNSLAQIGTKYFGATDTGIYEITGATDSGADIATYIQTGLMDFGTSYDKSVSDAYLAVDIGGRLALGVRVSEKPGPAEIWYEVTMTKDAIGNVKIPLGRGLKGRYWKFDIASEALSSFDAVSVLPSKLTRRV